MSALLTNGLRATATADNDVATATLPFRAPMTQLFVTSVQASYSATKSGKVLEIKDGDTVVETFHIYDSDQIPLPIPIPITPGNSASAVLAASGTGGTVGAVNLQGYYV